DVEPRKCDGYAYRAQLTVLSGQPGRALDDLAVAADGVADHTQCMRTLISLSMEQHDEAHADAAIDKVARAGCPPDVGCADNYAYLAQIEEQRGNLRLARAFYQKAYEVSADRDDLLASQARVASALGLHVEALQVYQRLAESKPGDARWPALVAAERAAVVG